VKYSLGETLADYGFSFFEKLHSPIFLVHRNGTIRKINEAGRKLLFIGNITGQQLDNFAKEVVTSNLRCQQLKCPRILTAGKHIKLILKQLQASDYLLVELVR
jgi:hypothetical protein